MVFLCVTLESRALMTFRSSMSCSERRTKKEELIIDSINYSIMYWKGCSTSYNECNESISY